MVFRFGGPPSFRKQQRRGCRFADLMENPCHLLCRDGHLFMMVNALAKVSKFEERNRGKQSL